MTNESTLKRDLITWADGVPPVELATGIDLQTIARRGLLYRLPLPRVSYNTTARRAHEAQIITCWQRAVDSRYADTYGDDGSPRRTLSVLSVAWLANQALEPMGLCASNGRLGYVLGRESRGDNIALDDLGQLRPQAAELLAEARQRIMDAITPAVVDELIDWWVASRRARHEWELTPVTERAKFRWPTPPKSAVWEWA
ncbi:hypothetical protein CWT12_06375 [Actinomyces sp. 432]|uniref:hypothetical protein n=1 Tax=Actinomyces sp. 432 TaxID=2057798 RepID=UPI001373BE25|nr:hypothetical protein [Actinomyces sp. 432]QHO91014.1 hypothetical protein CWT12_06375 [Actinomyces sp. 432]